MSNEEKILGMLETLAADISGLKANDEKIFGVLESLTADVSVLKADMSEVKDHMNNIELSAADTNDRVRKVYQSIASFKFDIMSLSDTLRDRFMNFTEKLTSIEQKVKHHEDILYSE